MTPAFRETIRRFCRPLEPIPTGETPSIEPLTGIRAVLFDVYGTLLVSGIGEVGTEGTDDQSRAFTAALAAVGIDARGAETAGVQTLIETIGRHRQLLMQQGIETPDVDILAVWRDTLETLATDFNWTFEIANVDLRQLAIEYECRANPVWPMPCALECLSDIAAAELRLGIISNAQFFTLPILAELLETSLAEIGFEAELEFLSYRGQWAKPGRPMYERAREALAGGGIAAGETLFVGNDLLNDVLPASQVGFRTALFAGDQRSLRWRAGDDRVRDLKPDRVLTSLHQLPACLGIGESA